MKILRATPTIQLWHLLLVPLQGEVSDEQAEHLSDDVLHKIRASDISGLIIDVTGLWLMDSHLCALISRLARAAELMGARTYLCGLNSEIAVTLQTMGLTLDGISTVRSLEDALAKLGIGPTANGDVPDEAHDEPHDLGDLEQQAKRAALLATIESPRR